MKLSMRGAWPDPDERLLLVKLLLPHIPDGDRWVVRLATGAEQVLTHDPQHPWDVARPSQLLELWTAGKMRVPPRYISWNRARDDLRFASANAMLLLAQIILWYDVGPERIKAEMVGQTVKHA
jgi:hypothetical protein